MKLSVLWSVSWSWAIMKFERFSERQATNGPEILISFILARAAFRFPRNFRYAFPPPLPTSRCIRSQFAHKAVANTKSPRNWQSWKMSRMSSLDVSSLKCNLVIGIAANKLLPVTDVRLNKSEHGRLLIFDMVHERTKTSLPVEGKA